jgi:hypothetical protein
MRAREAHELDDLGRPRVVHAGGTPERDRVLLGGRLVRHGEPAHPVVDRTGDACGADGVEGVHRSDEAEPRCGGDVTEARHVQLAFAHHRDEHVQRLLRHPVDLLDVEERPLSQRRHERAVDEHVRVVPVCEHSSGIEVTDQPGRCQLGVALDELEPDAELVRDRSQQRRLPGAGRPLDEHVTVGCQCRDDELDLAPAADELRPEALDECHGASWTMIPRRFSPSRIAW